MLSTGIVRKLDQLGRITLPMELRRNLGIQTGDPIEVFIENDKIILRKYNPNDIFDEELDEGAVYYKGFHVSEKSLRNLLKIADIKAEKK